MMVTARIMFDSEAQFCDAKMMFGQMLKINHSIKAFQNINFSALNHALQST